MDTEHRMYKLAKNMKPCKKEWEKLGFIFMDIEDDDVLCDVVFPDGWYLESTDSLFSKNIVDQNGNNRGSMSIKPDLYDRNASMYLQPRYRICSEYNYGEVKTELLYFGNDDEKIFVEGEAIVDYSLKEEDFNRESDLRAMYVELLEEAADEYYPGWRSVGAYWGSNNIKQKTK